MGSLVVSLIVPLLLVLSWIQVENQNSRSGCDTPPCFLSNWILKRFLFCVLLALPSCTEVEENDIYAEVLSPYCGDNYCISEVRCCRFVTGFPSVWTWSATAI